MDDIDVKGECDDSLCENFDIGNWDDDDDTNNEAHIEQENDAGDVHSDLMIVLSQQLDTEVAREHKLMTVTISSNLDLYVGLKTKARKSL